MFASSNRAWKMIASLLLCSHDNLTVFFALSSWPLMPRTWLNFERERHDLASELRHM